MNDSEHKGSAEGVRTGADSDYLLYSNILTV